MTRICRHISTWSECAQRRRLDAPPVIHIRAYRDGDYLTVDVTDNGNGIDGKDLERIGSAGYSTKNKGRGLGIQSRSLPSMSSDALVASCALVVTL